MRRISYIAKFAAAYLVLQFCASPHTRAADIQWRHDLQTAAHSAAAHGKPLLVKVSTTWCGPCKRMQRETFRDERIASHVAQCFIPVALDGDRDAELVRKMGVSAYPTTLVMSSDLNVVKRITGYRTASQLSRDLGGLCSHSQANTASDVAANSSRAASVFAGWCPVSPVLDGEFVRGKPAVRAAYRGYELLFRDEQHRQEFFEQPQRYWPVANGQCAVSWLDEQVVRQGSIQFGLEHQGTIWFFSSDAHRIRFASNPEAYLQRLSGGRSVGR